MRRKPASTQQPAVRSVYGQVCVKCKSIYLQVGVAVYLSIQCLLICKCIKSFVYIGVYLKLVTQL